MSRRRASILPGCLAFLAGSLCILALAALAAWVIIPAQAAAVFGAPQPNLRADQVFIYSLRLLLAQDALLRPAQPAGVPVEFKVELGEPVASILERMAAQGLISDAEALRVYLQYTGLDTQLQAGRFFLNPAQPGVEVARELLDPSPSQVEFRVLPGWRLEEIAAALPTSGLTFSAEALLAAAARPPADFGLAAPAPGAASCEGYLLPGVYTFERSLTPPAFLQAMVGAFQALLDQDAGLLEGFARQGLELHQAVTLASIVQREALVADEMPLIAGVYLNRLRLGMKLDADPTVQYALGITAAGWWKSPLALADLEVQSPYNTYLTPGLPPGPIAAPGPAALRAVAAPAESDYLYFRAACDGSGRHNFARTLEEQVANQCP